MHKYVFLIRVAHIYIANTYIHTQGSYEYRGLPHNKYVFLIRVALCIDTNPVNIYISVRLIIYIYLLYWYKPCVLTSNTNISIFTGWRRPIGCLNFPFYDYKGLIIGLFCGKWPIIMRHLMGLGHPFIDKQGLNSTYFCICTCLRTFTRWYA